MRILYVGTPGEEKMAELFDQKLSSRFGADTRFHTAYNMRDALKALSSDPIYDIALLGGTIIPTHTGCQLEDLQNPLAPAINIAFYSRWRNVPLIAIVDVMDTIAEERLRPLGARTLTMPVHPDVVFDEIMEMRRIDTPFPV